MDQMTTHSNQPKQMFVTPCKYAMKCTRRECTGAHPNPRAPATARVSKPVKMCRDDLSCTRPDCYFGHKSPECLNISEEQYMERCDEIGGNFYAFWENEHPSVPREDALQLYLTEFFPSEARAFISHCIETAELFWEERQIAEEMEQCEEAYDALHPPVVEETEDDLLNAFLDEQEENQDKLEEEMMHDGDEFFAELPAST